jgi:hypothetical protein
MHGERARPAQQAGKRTCLNEKKGKVMGVKTEEVTDGRNMYQNIVAQGSGRLAR